MSRFSVTVSRIESIALDTRLFELSASDGVRLPAAEPGAHVDVQLSDGLIRSYSLLTPLCTTQTYAVAVQRAAASRGGSLRLHEEITVGTVLQISAPRNHFPLNERASETLLLAGGIGITPLYGMFERLQSLGRPVHLHYWCRSPQHILFRDRLEHHPNVTIHHSVLGRATLPAVLEDIDPLTEIYCCGPQRMLSEFERGTRMRPRDKLHVEHFNAAPDAPTAPTLPTVPTAQPLAEYSLLLAKSGLEVRVGPGQSMLQALCEANVDVSYSCEEGVCGACETRFLAGIPLHRDRVRTADEHDRLSTVMICCAGSRTTQLTLDL